jgi:hypothetical protein
LDRLAIRVDRQWHVEPGDYVVSAARHAADPERLDQSIAIDVSGAATR